MKLRPGQHVHLVGIGGSGLSAIARILLGQGYQVSGSDREASSLTDGLVEAGARVFIGHSAEQINGADAVIITSAVRSEHVEVAAARARGIPVYRRQDIIADLMTGRQVIAVAGTHGKTTTTSMIVHLLREVGADPSYIVGGVMGNSGLNAAVGSGHHFVIEADEYDNMFHGLNPDVAIITSVEYDHPDFFQTPADLQASFARFITLLDQSPLGDLIACADDPGARQLGEARSAAGERVHFYGENAVDLRVAGIQTAEAGVSFQCRFPDEPARPVQLAVPGVHNALNAAAALLAARLVGVGPLDRLIAALRSFRPAARRFDVRADVGGVAVVDDYAHHPTAIRATLQAARQRYPERVIWAVWQPHTYTRTRALLAEFAAAFDAADHVLVTDIYAAREQPLAGVTAQAVVERMRYPDARHTPSLDDALETLLAGVTSPAVVIIMSAGDAPRIGVEFLRRFGSPQS